MAFYKGFMLMLMLMLLPQLLMQPFDTLPLPCRHIGHMHEGVCLKIIISNKMTAMRT